MNKETKTDILMNMAVVGVWLGLIALVAIGVVLCFSRHGTKSVTAPAAIEQSTVTNAAPSGVVEEYNVEDGPEIPATATNKPAGINRSLINEGEKKKEVETTNTLIVVLGATIGGRVQQ